MIIKLLAAVGIIAIIMLITFIYALIMVHFDDVHKREKWSRTLEEPDTGNEDFKKYIMDRFTKVR